MIFKYFKIKRKRWGFVLFVVLGILAWFGAYGPAAYLRSKVLEELNAQKPHWVCVINSDAVSSQYEVYVTRKYILLDGQRFYSDALRRIGEDAGYVLFIVDDNRKVYWMRLSSREAASYSADLGIHRAGCRRMIGAQPVGGAFLPVTPPPGEPAPVGAMPPQDFTPAPGAPPAAQSLPSEEKLSYPREETPEPFSWEKALSPALKPVKKSH